jgi:hypothetical protein
LYTAVQFTALNQRRIFARLRLFASGAVPKATGGQMSDQSDALRQAAAMLLNAASAGAVIRAVKTLLDAMEADRPVMPAAEPAQTPPQAVQAAGRANGAPTVRPAPAPSTPPADGAWERLRQQIRTERNARGLTLRQLAEQLELSATTLTNAVQSRRRPSQAMQERLQTWLSAGEAQAPEVVPAEAVFRGNNGAARGTGTARFVGNGADDHAGAAAA